MDLGKLEREGFIRKSEKDDRAASAMLKNARLDLNAARHSLASEDYGWSLAIAYNAMLQAARGLMLKHGFQPAGDPHHYSAVKFAAEALGPESSTLVSLFNRTRKKRHEVIAKRINL